MTTDCDFVLAQLQDGSRTTMQLITASIYERGCGLTPHSRVADLRRDGHDVRCARVGSKNGRGVYEYTLLSDAGPVEPAGTVDAESQGAEIPAAPVDAPIPGQLVLVA